MLDGSAHHPYLIVPGWGGSGNDHWQTLWTSELDAARMQLDDWFDPRRETWLSRFDQALASLHRHDPRPPIVVAHSLGCIVVAWYARSATLPIRAALLVAPADVERTCLPTLHQFCPVPRRQLPFDSLVIASDDDPYATLTRAGELAAGWNSSLRVVHAGGHLNAHSGLGRWAEGRAFLAELAA